MDKPDNIGEQKPHGAVFTSVHEVLFYLSLFWYITLIILQY